MKWKDTKVTEKVTKDSYHTDALLFDKQVTVVEDYLEIPEFWLTEI